MKKISKGITACAVLLLFVSGCSQSKKSSKSAEATPKQEIVVNSAGKIVSLDSAGSSDIYSSETLGQIFEGLYRINQDGEVELGIASKEPDVSQDGTVYTFTLRDAKWSNGDKVTAGDFVYSFRKVVTPATQSTSGTRFDVIQNAADIRSGKKEPETLGVKALDDQTLEIKLNAAVPYFARLLTGTPFLPQHEKSAKALGKAYGTKSKDLVVNGAFTIADWTGTNDTWTLVKNKNYWDADTVKLSQVKVNAVENVATGISLYEAGQADFTTVTDNYVKEYQNNKDFHTVSKSTVGYLAYNTKRKVTGNVHVRRAISQAIDKAIYVKNILADGSKAINGLVPNDFSQDPKSGQEFREENGDLLPYDLTAAQADWQTAQKELQSEKISLELLVAEFPFAKKTAAYLQSELEKNLPGLKITIRAVPLSNRLDDNRSGNFDFFFGTWTPDFADPVNFLEGYQTTGGINFGKYSNPVYDQGIAEVKTTLANQPEARWQKLLAIEKLGIEEDAAITPLYQSAVNYLQSQRVKGIQIFPFGRQTSFRYAEVVQ